MLGLRQQAFLVSQDERRHRQDDRCRRKAQNRRGRRGHVRKRCAKRIGTETVARDPGDGSRRAGEVETGLRHRIGPGEHGSHVAKKRQKARDEKTVRFLGITGHYDPAILIQGLNRFDFDTILMALNPSDPHHLSFQDELLPLANKKNMGVIGMKIPARGQMFREGGLTSMKDAMHYVLSKPISTVIVGCDTVAQLEENVKIASEFEPMSAEDMARVEEACKSYWADASFYKKGGAREQQRSGLDTQGFPLLAE